MANEEEKSDIVIVLDETGTDLDKLTALLKQAGVQIDKIDPDNGVIEATYQTSKIKSLESLPGIKFVRDVFNYVDDQDGPDDDTIPG
jgi:nitrate reductase NapAB chaperone NapD